MNKYNAATTSQLSWDDLSTESSSQAVIYHDESEVPNYVKHQAVRALHQCSRSSEEVLRIKDEMRNCVHHYLSIYDMLSSTKQHIIASDESGHYTSGCVSLLTHKMSQCAVHIDRFRCFTSHVPLPEQQMTEAIDNSAMTLQSHVTTDVNDMDTCIRIAEANHMVSSYDSDSSELKSDSDSGTCYRVENNYINTLLL